MSYQSSEHISRWAEVVSAGEPLSPTSHTSSPRSPQPNYRRKKRPGRITFKKDPWTMPPPKPVQTRYTGLAERLEMVDPAVLSYIPPRLDRTGVLIDLHPPGRPPTGRKVTLHLAARDAAHPYVHASRRPRLEEELEAIGDETVRDLRSLRPRYVPEPLDPEIAALPLHATEQREALEGHFEPIWDVDGDDYDPDILDDIAAQKAALRSRVELPRRALPLSKLDAKTCKLLLKYKLDDLATMEVEYEARS